MILWAKRFVQASVLTIVVSCIDPYSPPVTDEEIQFLVVDGFINASKGEAIVKLSRASNLNSESFIGETGASVKIIDDQSNEMELIESATGSYSISEDFDFKKKYSIKINTKGKTYRSNSIRLENSTPIDSLNWRVENDEFKVYVNSHDFSTSIGYYKYILEEVYEYRAPLFSFYMLQNGKVVDRLPDNDIYHCWMTNKDHDEILLATSQNLSQNVISNFKVISIQQGDKRLWHKYSILVSQVSIDKQTFDYWTQLKKINEGVGGLFDPIPYAVKGNVYCESDPSELVLGYFYGGGVTQKRIIVNNLQLPDGFQIAKPTDCKEDYVPIGNISSLEGKDVIITIHRLALTTVIGYYYTKPICGDCRLQGGTTLKPDFM